jgi:hypothetical protein
VIHEDATERSGLIGEVLDLPVEGIDEGLNACPLTGALPGEGLFEKGVEGEAHIETEIADGRQFLQTPRYREPLFVEYGLDLGVDLAMVPPGAQIAERHVVEIYRVVSCIGLNAEVGSQPACKVIIEKLDLAVDLYGNEFLADERYDAPLAEAGEELIPIEGILLRFYCHGDL